ncbi:cation diffusion facilitator family transporter [Caldimonas tepidiphila]|uniref:cation diffusion facilitator family transporter n=1 Tax=Caldimonas tepidiphila TaxID=2315841 RepID=UPI000E5B6FC8|nr:cation diffusion facilitator family transporter [Caldimonas tepidiphila]
MQVHTFLRLSVAAALATILLKTLAWWFTGSVGLLSDAMESFVNLAAALFALWIVSVASTPPDAGHPYGHAKAEYFSSGFEGLLILGAALGIAWAAIRRFADPQPIESVGLGVALSAVSTLINGALAFWMLRASRQFHSIVLEADARHLMTDVWTSVGVIAGVLLVPVTGWLWLDPLLALAVAANISREAYSLLRRSVEGLMDHALEPAEQAALERAMGEIAGREGLEVNDVKTRRAGARRYCELHLHVPAHWSVARAMRVREQLARALLGTVPHLHLTIELLPVGQEPLVSNDEDAQAAGDGLARETH